MTGTLGAAAHMFLALVVYPIEGQLINAGGLHDLGFGPITPYELVLGAAGVFPLLALVLLFLWWPPGSTERLASA